MYVHVITSLQYIMSRDMASIQHITLVMYHMSHVHYVRQHRLAVRDTLYYIVMLYCTRQVV